MHTCTACQPFLSLMLPRKGQPFPPERRNCSHTFRSVLHFRLPSAPQRYNTLDFPTENRVPTGMLLAPIGNPEPKGLSPLGQLWCPDSQVEQLPRFFCYVAVIFRVVLYGNSCAFAVFYVFTISCPWARGKSKLMCKGVYIWLH